MARPPFIAATAAVCACAAAPVASWASPAMTYATNLPGVRAVAAPPLHFDPTRASDADLAAYGFPPRPDRARTPAQYQIWADTLSHAKTRLIPHLAATRRRHLSWYSENWAGYMDANPFFGQYNSFSMVNVYAKYTVPTPSQPGGGCLGARYASEWVGIDGYFSGDVLQAGTDTDSFCYGAYRTQTYQPWFEWYPAYGTNITNLSVTAGQVVFIGVWATSPTQGNAYLQNLSTGASVGVQFGPPAGTRLVGNSAEWILERPEINNKLTQLAHATPVTMNGWAQNAQGGIFFPGQAEWGYGLASLTMLDDGGAPEAYATVNSVTTITIQVEGSAN